MMSERTCAACAYAIQPTPQQQFNAFMARWTCPLTCMNHADSPGALHDTWPGNTCRNFRAKAEPKQQTDLPEPPNDEIRYIALTQGKYVIVDTADYAWLNQWKWCAARTGNQWYAYRKHHGKTLCMHRLIMKPPTGMVVDHINGNGLDNRRVNLRICTQRQNNWNHRRRKQKNASSRFIGVHRDKRHPGKCYVRVTRDGQATNLGPFDDEVEAARARDRIAVELHGPFAYLNFPDEPPADDKPSNQG